MSGQSQVSPPLSARKRACLLEGSLLHYTSVPPNLLGLTCLAQVRPWPTSSRRKLWNGGTGTGISVTRFGDGSLVGSLQAGHSPSFPQKSCLVTCLGHFLLTFLQLQRTRSPPHSPSFSGPESPHTRCPLTPRPPSSGLFSPSPRPLSGLSSRRFPAPPATPSGQIPSYPPFPALNPGAGCQALLLP